MASIAISKRALNCIPTYSTASDTLRRYQVVIAGSNGYVNKSSDVVPGYDTGNYLDGKAINAPNDCNGASTYIGNQYWNDGKPFDTARCASACRLTHAAATITVMLTTS